MAPRTSSNTPRRGRIPMADGIEDGPFRWRNVLPAAGNAFANIFFPRRCLGCGRWTRRSFLCERCFAEIKFVPDNACAKCGRWLSPSATRRTCVQCEKRRIAYDEAVIAGYYQGLWKSIVLSAKSGSAAATETLAQCLADRVRAREDWPAIDFVTAVPIHWRSWLWRGWNHAAHLGTGVARHLDLAFISSALRKKRYTPSQTSLPAEARFANVRGAFVARSRLVRDKTILLVDNMITTGATSNECARALLQAGAKRVYVAVAARAGS